MPMTIAAEAPLKTATPGMIDCKMGVTNSKAK